MPARERETEAEQWELIVSQGYQQQSRDSGCSAASALPPETTLPSRRHIWS